MSGHAGYDEPGRDIVCAAVSAVAQAAVLGIQEVVGYPADVDVDDDGYLHITLSKYQPDGFSEVQVLFQTAYAALLEIAREYPDRVSINVE